jgi:outer membrane protein TolC
MPLPKVKAPRKLDDAEAQETWPMTLREAFRIALDNSEIVRVISFGSQGIPIGGFEPTALKTGACAQGCEANAAPIVSVNDSITFQSGLSKRTDTGALIGVVHNVNWSYQNSSFLVFPSAYTTNLHLTLTQPLLGSAPLPGQAAGPPVGLEANRAPIVISRLNADASAWRFKAELLAEVRSVEQQYWNLAQAHVQLWAADRAVSLAKEILEREQAELLVGRGTVADVAEAVQRLEQFNLDLVTRTSDVITTERQLRNLLGLPPADQRRIIPVTPPVETSMEFDWDSCLHEMMEEQPDIVQQQSLVRVAELQLLLARNGLLPELSLNALDPSNGLGRQLDTGEAVMVRALLMALNPVIADDAPLAGLGSIHHNFPTTQLGFTSAKPIGRRGPLVNSRQAQYILLRSRASLQQVVHQTTHSLARFFLEIDANYKQFKTASRLRAAAAQRLDAQRAYYEEGRITIDRFLDAVSQYATAVATEAQYKTTYNISLAALGEAKGTLLADRGIVVAQPHPCKAYIQADDVLAAHGQDPGPLESPLTPAKPVEPSKASPSQSAKTAPPACCDGKQDRQALTASFEPEKHEGAEVPRLKSIPEPQAVSEATTTCFETKTQATGGATQTETACPGAKTDAPAKGKTWTFSISIGGAKPIQIKGTITADDTDEAASASH